EASTRAGPRAAPLRAPERLPRGPRVAHGQVSQAELRETGGRLAQLGRAPQALDRTLVLVALVVHPAFRRERELAHLLRRELQRELGGGERGVQVLAHLGERGRALEVRDGLGVIRAHGAQHLLRDAAPLAELALRLERLEERRVRGRGHDLARALREDALRR